MHLKRQRIAANIDQKREDFITHHLNIAKQKFPCLEQLKEENFKDEYLYVLL